MPEKRVWSVVEWAGSVSRYDPWSLVSLEDALLRDGPANRERLQHGIRGRFWAKAWLTVFALVAVAPLAAPIVFTSGKFRGTSRTYDATWAYPTAAIVSWLGILALGIFYVQSRRQRPARLRHPNGTKLAITYAIGDVLALRLGYARADTFDGSIGWYVLPMWILLPVSVISVIYQFRSPRNPVSEWRYDLNRIHEADQAWMLEERDQALRILERRGLLVGDKTPDELATRPLGALHLSGEERPED